MSKKMERLIKSLYGSNPDHLSVIQPKKYQKRFAKFCSESIFKARIKNENSKNEFVLGLLTEIDEYEENDGEFS